MSQERDRVHELLGLLAKADSVPFPETGTVDAPKDHGVYLIRDPGGHVLHVGRTVRAKDGLRQRLNNHLRGQSSFVKEWLGGEGGKLRKGHTYLFVVVEDDRPRLLLEYAATVEYSPKHLGVGKKVE